MTGQNFKYNVLLTGAGAPGGPGIIKAIKQSPQINVVAADADEFAAGRFLTEKFELIPRASDANFIPEIRRICSRHNIHVVFPLVTNELFLFALHKKEFIEAGIKVVVSDNDSLQLANNKRMLYEHLDKKDILVPQFHSVKTVEEFIAAAKALKYPGMDFCFKPCVSNGSRGFRIVSQTRNEFDLLFNQKPANAYITFEKAVEILSSKPFPELIATELLPGDEFTIDTILDKGELKIILPRKRIKMREGISIRGEFVDHTEIINYCRKILGSLHLHGPIGIQVKQARDGTFKILEINPRIQGTSVAALGMQINLPLMAIYQELGLDTGELKSKVKWGTKFTRYYDEVFY
jgi:carbamoyl-phosphate synthase large subunit